MTVISAMRFNPEMAAIVADEEMSYWVRKIKMAAKLKRVSFDGLDAVVGAAGNASITYQIFDQLTNENYRAQMDKADGELDRYLFGMMMANSLNSGNHVLIEGYLNSHYGLSELDFQTKEFANGNQINDFLLSDYQQLVNFQHPYSEMLISNLLAIVADERGVDIVEVSACGGSPALSPVPYSTTGSGSDAADNSLSDYMETLPRDEWENSDPVRGLMELVSATNKATKRNSGVGGTQHIHILSSDGFLSPPGENESRLASEIVDASDTGLLNGGAAYALVKSLMFEGMPFKKAERAFWRSFDKEERDIFRFHLRGYRVFG